MTLYEFNVLDLNNKMESINQLGVYLDNHTTKDEKFNLYAIDMFFVEVCYNSIENSIFQDIKGYLYTTFYNPKQNIGKIECFISFIHSANKVFSR